MYTKLQIIILTVNTVKIVKMVSDKLVQASPARA